MEDEDPDYEPNLFEAKDSDEQVDVSNCKPPPETIAVQENDRVCHVGNTLARNVNIFKFAKSYF